MAFVFTGGQVAVSDPSTGGGPSGPTATSNIKDVVMKAVKLTSANFSTTGVNTKVAVLPPDASIVRLSLWTNVQLAGGSISAATISLIIAARSYFSSHPNCVLAFVASPINRSTSVGR